MERGGGGENGRQFFSKEMSGFRKNLTHVLKHLLCLA